MTILSKIIKEISLKPGIYDLYGNNIENILGSKTLNKNGSKNINNNYLTAKQIVNRLKNSFDNNNINYDFFKIILDNNRGINPQSGYWIKTNNEKINLYSLNKVINIIAKKKNNTDFLYGHNENGNLIYILDPFFYEKLLNFKKNKIKKETEEEVWEKNRNIRKRYDKDE